MRAPDGSSRETSPGSAGEVTIIGAGLAGSLLAIYMARRGYQVEVFERRPDLRRGDVPAGRSINLALANRGISALDEIGLMGKVKPLLIAMAGRMLHDESSALHFLPYGNKPDEVIYSVSRGGLNGLLLDAAESTGRVTIQFGRSCRAVDLDRSVLEMADEAELIPFRLLFGADGSASAVREAIIRAASGNLTDEPLGHSYKELSIPPADGGGFRMHKEALHIWPRGEYMLIALPNIDGSFTVTLFLPNEGKESFEGLSSAEAVRDLFARRFPDAIPLMPTLEQDFFSNPTGHLETVRCFPWHYRDRALILGDAAHAIVPFHGQGMNAAFEDCSALNACFADVSTGIEEVFRRFEDERKPNAEAIADMALENYIEMRSTVLDAKFALKKSLAFELEERFPLRFIPRYSMVMFHRISYAEAKRRGALQDALLDELTRDADSIEAIDMKVADELVRRRL